MARQGKTQIQTTKELTTMRIYEIGVQFNGETFHTGLMKCTLHDALAVISKLNSHTIFHRFTLRSYCI